MVQAWQLSAGALVDAYATGHLSPVQALRSVLARLDAVNPQINAVIARDDEAALAAACASAQRWQQGQPLSPLDGVPISVKDNIAQRGLPCRWGSQLFADHRPTRDELPVARLRAAGAVLFGKTNVPEFTLQGYTDNALFGPTRNPWDLALTPGGSSGGAVAAVAAGIGPLALATDGGGSIRRPCAYTGLVGLKPGWGVVPRADGLPELLPGLEVIGPIARSLDDLARMLQVIAPDMRHAFDTLPAPRPLRMAHWRCIGTSPVDSGITAAIDAAAARLRAMGHRVDMTEAPAEVEAFNRQAWPVLSATGLAAVMEPLRGRESALTPAMARLLVAGRACGATDLAQARALQRALRSAMGAVFAHYDLVLTPACAAMPWAATHSHPETIDGQAVDARGHAVFTALANGAGLPALTLPAGRVGALPVGLQLLGRHGSDARLWALGQSFLAHQPQPWRWPVLPPTLLEESLAV